MVLARREFLYASIVAPIVAAKSAAQPALDRGFGRVERLADGVYVTIADPSKGSQCLSNGGILVGRDAVLIVEGHFQPEGAAFEVDAARRLSDRPIRGAVDTHFHLDHTFGNAGYRRQRVPIIAHERTATLMASEYGALKGRDTAVLLADIGAKIAQEQNATDRRHLESDLAAAKWMYTAIRRAELVYPDERLHASDFPTTIELGGLTAVLECHAGHTPADVTVSVPERDVVFAGDLLFHREYPVCISADMVRWRQVLDLFARRRAHTRFVPGHGPVTDVTTVRSQADVMDDLRHHAEAMMRLGATPDEAERRYVVPAAFREYEIFAWGWTIGAAMRSYYRRVRV